MSRKNRDFDAQFEAFLQESLSSEDSINSARINKILEQPAKKKKPWWDDDDDDSKKELNTSKSFLKKKVPDNSNVKATDNRKSDGRSAPKIKPRKDAKLRVKAESSISKDSLDDISEKSEEDHGDHGNRFRVHVPEESMDSINTEDLLNPAESPGKLGMDTLDEMADKEKFFRDLEKNADGTIDYGRLNQELSCTANTLSPEMAARTGATLAALKDIEDEDEEDDMVPSTPSAQLLSERDQSEQKPSMLSKVSLMDSLESTMNTTTSPQVGKSTLREAKDMLEEKDEDDFEHGTEFRPSHSGPETLKTATGFIGTNTSQEIEALHNALEKLGLSATIGNDSQLDLSSQGVPGGTEDLVKKLLNNSTGKQRNVAEIMKELEDLQTKIQPSDDRNKSPKGIERQYHIEDDADDLRGFDLSPAHPYPVEPDYSQRGDSSHRGGFDTSHTEDTEMYRPVIEVSVSEKGKGKKKDSKKRADKRKPKDKLDSSRKQDSTVRRSRSSSPMKIDYSETLKWKHKSIKSSGYGQVYSPPKPPRDKSRDREHELLGYNRYRRDNRDTQRDTSNDRTDTRRDRMMDTQDTGTRREDNMAKPVASPRKQHGNINSSAWSPIDVSKHKIKGSTGTRQVKLGSVAGTQLDASIESFANYIKEHFAGKNIPPPEVKYSVEEPAVSSSFKEKVELDEDGEKDKIIEQLKGEMEAMERSYERKFQTLQLEYEQQIADLKQENFVLNAKVSGEGDSEMKRKVLANEPLEGVTKDQLESLQRDLREQETLISGYQQENKRLYDEMKNLKKQSKQLEERMFQENQKLLAEAANLRIVKNDRDTATQLEQKEEQYQNKGLITGPAAQQKIAAGNTEGAVAHLEAELSQAKRMCDTLHREMSVLQQSRTEIQKHVEKLVIERENLTKTIEDSKSLKSEEARALERQYEKEMEKLKNKLKWYAENQEMLDKGARKLKSREDEIHKLKMRIEDMQTESGKRVEDSKARAKERAGDTKKIQDLQRQVKEMEAILKRRNPNSLPSLMIAAAAAPESNANNRTAYTEVLESRVKKLEKDLDEKDGDTDRLMRGVEQKYHSIKLQFEERIKELEIQLSIYQGQSEHVHPHTHSVALERELESVRERYKIQVKELQAEIDRLTSELSKSKKSSGGSEKSDGVNAQEVEAELRVLVNSLKMEVENKNHDLQVMQKSLERLRKEKQISFTPQTVKKGKMKGKGGKSDNGDTIDTEFSSLPAQTGAEKEYEPKIFEDAHISDVLKENEDLKTKVDRLHLKLDQNRVDLRKVVAENEAILRETRENFEEKVEQQRRSHQQEVKRVISQQALEHSTSRVAELQSKVDTQEVMIKHLREQQARLEVEAETAAVLRIKQTRLEESLKSLYSELKEAKKTHSPEMRHFEALQDKIVQIEAKHSTREQELHQIIRNSKLNASIETEKEVEKWRKLVETKNNEIQKFRMELDSILEVIRVLQKQGVVIPVSSNAVS